MKKEKRLLTAQELAEKLNIKIGWIYQRTQHGAKSLPHLKVGGLLRFDYDEVLDFLKTNTI